MTATLATRQMRNPQGFLTLIKEIYAGKDSQLRVLLDYSMQNLYLFLKWQFCLQFCRLSTVNTLLDVFQSTENGVQILLATSCIVLSATTTCSSRSYLLINLSIFHRCNGGIGLVIHPIIYVLADIYVKVNKLNTWLPSRAFFFWKSPQQFCCQQLGIFNFKQAFRSDPVFPTVLI